MVVHGEVEAAFVVDISVAEVFLEVDALMILCASDGEKTFLEEWSVVAAALAISGGRIGVVT